MVESGLTEGVRRGKLAIVIHINIASFWRSYGDCSNDVR